MKRAGWLVPVLLAAGAAFCAWRGVARTRGTDALVPATGPAPTTPLLSARRLPIALGTLVADQRLALRLDANLADPALATDQVCLEVAIGGTPVFARDPATALIPASNLKLLTADAAIRRLGASAIFTTHAVAQQPPRNGAINGPLWLVGGGDPLLATPGFRATQKEWTESREPITSLDELAARIRAAGVTHIIGSVIGDDTRYDRQHTLPSWRASYLASGEIGPVSALVVDGGLDTGAHRRVAVADPAAAAAQALTTLLQAHGVTVDGAAASGTAPPNATSLATIDSPPLSDIVGVMLRESDNLAAEMLTKELGFRFGGSGTWAAGLRVMHDELAPLMPLDGLVQLDGSGLDRGDRLSCRTLAALMSSTDPATQVVAASLPTAGNCGTLVKRLGRAPTAGRVRAKTGSLTGVAALTGYVAATAPDTDPACPPGAPVAERVETFALLVNGVPSEAAGSAIEDRLANALASYPEMPALDLFGPQ